MHQLPSNFTRPDSDSESPSSHSAIVQRSHDGPLSFSSLVILSSCILSQRYDFKPHSPSIFHSPGLFDLLIQSEGYRVIQISPSPGRRTTTALITRTTLPPGDSIRVLSNCALWVNKYPSDLATIVSVSSTYYFIPAFQSSLRSSNIRLSFRARYFIQLINRQVLHRQ